ncbi:MAG: PilZ domain-containing protein [Alphaproteobacteria bacterium]|nr:PilZ domain-containing protein [Alphaproteobacteria bacterium]
MSTQEFLRQRAVNLVIGGRYSFANRYDPEGKRREFACRTSRVSPFRMLVSVPIVGMVGERVDAYFHDFGQLNGRISDTAAGGFCLELELERRRREKMADMLKWLEKKQQDVNVQDERAKKRIIPENPHSTLVFSDGSQRSCFVIDVSSSGVAVSADACPEIGTPLAVGSAVGRVVRHFREGFAVKFVHELDAASLERFVIRTAIPSKAKKPAIDGLRADEALRA